MIRFDQFYKSGDHGHSKERMLNRCFSKKQKHVWTEHKQFVRVNHMIDDRLKNFVGFDNRTSFVHFKTAYEEGIPTCENGHPVDIKPHLHSNNWTEIVKYIR